MDRRTLLRRGSVAGLAASAGCLGLLGGGGGDGPDQGGYEDWVGDARGFEATVDRTDADEVRVLVGAGDQGLSFDPAGVAATTGTTVVWEWTGDGGSHNVVSKSDLFESAFTTRSGHTFEYTVEGMGVYKYYCKPHRANGMKGAIRVEE